MPKTKTSIEDSRKTRLIEFNDLVQTAVLLTTAVPALLLPVRHWEKFSAAVARLSRLSKPGEAGMVLRRIERFFPRGCSTGARSSLPDRIVARHIEENMIFIRLYGRPAWRPRLTADGMEELTAAAARGSVVLWCVNQIGIVILLKLLLHDAGYTLHHVRSWAHGPMPTRYGRRIINPLFWGVEDRYSRHLVVERHSPLSALRGAGRVLRAGGMVSIRSVDDSTAPAILPVLGGRMRIALGAPRIAFRHNAALIAVDCRPDGPGGWRFTFTPLGQEPGRSIESVIEEFRQLCERAFFEAPELWPARHRQFLPTPPA